MQSFCIERACAKAVKRGGKRTPNQADVLLQTADCEDENNKNYLNSTQLIQFESLKRKTFRSTMFAWPIEWP